MNEQLDIAINFIKSKTKVEMTFDDAGSLINHLSKLKTQEELSEKTPATPEKKKK